MKRTPEKIRENAKARARLFYVFIILCVMFLVFGQQEESQTIVSEVCGDAINTVAQSTDAAAGEGQ